MRKQTTNGAQPSTVVWDNLEEWVRSKVQEFVQSLLEEEVTELLGRGRLQGIAYAGSRPEAARKRDDFLAWWSPPLPR